MVNLEHLVRLTKNSLTGRNRLMSVVPEERVRPMFDPDLDDRRSACDYCSTTVITSYNNGWGLLTSPKSVGGHVTPDHLLLFR